jgi:hypothetical protein
VNFIPLAQQGVINAHFGPNPLHYPTLRLWRRNRIGDEPG